MKSLLSNIAIRVNDRIFIKDPESSELGKKIISASILLINSLGFDNFTFRKLGAEIGSNESSIYRYFESKHKLLLYLASWYWGWMEYQLVFATHNLRNPKERLLQAISIFTQTTKNVDLFKHIDEAALSKLVINEYSKSYLTKEVDQENKDGYFEIYKRLVERLSNLISDVSPSYPHPNSLASTVIEGALHQHFLRDHFKSLTDCNSNIEPTEFFQDLVSKALSY